LKRGQQLRVAFAPALEISPNRSRFQVGVASRRGAAGVGQPFKRDFRFPIADCQLIELCAVCNQRMMEIGNRQWEIGNAYVV